MNKLNKIFLSIIIILIIFSTFMTFLYVIMRKTAQNNMNYFLEEVNKVYEAKKRIFELEEIINNSSDI